MKKTIDTQITEDPNVFGEILREYAFKEEYGCYSCFDLIDEFREVVNGTNTRETLLKLLGIHESQDDAEWPNDHLRDTARMYTNGNICVGWYWDGDGCLCFIEGEKCAINTDCKKSSNWEWESVEAT